MTGYPAPNEMLRQYATGAATPGVTLLVSAHLDLAKEQRAITADYEAAAGAFFEAESPAQMSGGALDAVLARLDGPQPKEVRLDPGPMPDCISRAVRKDFGDIPWKFRLPGLAEYEIPGYGAEKVSLLRARPGCGLPKHTHEGEEATLVLTGAMQDGDDVFRRGDVSLADETHDHTPKIIGDETCYCLVVLSGELRFTGLFSRALNYLGE